MASTNQASTSITIDESHPFFLHHAESPSAILVSQPLIGGENYPTWARSLERALRIKNKFWFINEIHLLVQSWARCNDIMVSWIINCVSPKIATSVVYRKTAKEVWKKLHDRLFQGNGSRILLMDPIPPVDKVYTLLIQEKRQRSVGQGSNNGPFVESTTLAAKSMTLSPKNSKKGKEIPTCSHCGLLCHTVEKCYKIHGYPSGYKTKPIK
ncbi:hypothetical protein ACB092_11G103900 [Castanea dentata]